MAYAMNDDYCEQAKNWQSVPSEASTRQALIDRGWEHDDKHIKDYRENTKYSCDDSYTMGTIQDDRIYVSTTDNQHAQILNNQSPTQNGGVSGYFTDQATIDHCSSSGTLDNGQLNRELQVAPYQAPGEEPGYKPHIDCFEINHDKLYDTYGTRDFNAALAKCEANNQFGEGGGNQGFNPNISEMMGNGCLTHDKENSYSDPKVSTLPADKLNENPMNNSTVSQATYDRMVDDYQDRAKDCVKNNTPHPSQNIVENTGYAPNPAPVEGVTGNAIIKDSDSKGIPTTNPDISNGNTNSAATGMPTTGISNPNTDAGKATSSEGMPTTAVGYTGASTTADAGKTMSSGMGI